MEKPKKLNTATQMVILILIMVGCGLALFFGFGMGIFVFGDNLFGKIAGVGLAFLMILGLGYIGEQTGVFKKN